MKIKFGLFGEKNGIPHSLISLIMKKWGKMGSWGQFLTSGDLRGQFFMAHVTPRGHSFPTVYGMWGSDVPADPESGTDTHTH